MDDKLSDFLKATFSNPETGDDMNPVSVRGNEDGLDHLEIIMEDVQENKWKYEIRISEV